MFTEFKVDKDYNNSRLDKWFKKNVLDIPQSLIQKIIRKKKIKLNNKKLQSSDRVKTGDLIKVYDLQKLNIKKKVFKKNKYNPSLKEKKKYEKFVLENNENFIILNKPAGIPVQGGTKSHKNIIDILKNTNYFRNGKPFIVHRIDKETSGVFMVAKNREYAQLFTSLFRLRKVHKTYLSIVYGKVSKNLNILKNNLIIYENNRKKIQNALTYIKVLKSNDLFSLLELKPITGRKHQLRKQLTEIGHPIVGDKKYYINKNKFNKNSSLLLHAHKIKFMINDVKFNFEANYEKNLEKFIRENFKSF